MINLNYAALHLDQDLKASGWVLTISGMKAKDFLLPNKMVHVYKTITLHTRFPTCPVTLCTYSCFHWWQRSSHWWEELQPDRPLDMRNVPGQQQLACCPSFYPSLWVKLRSRRWGLIVPYPEHTVPVQPSSPHPILPASRLWHFQAAAVSWGWLKK